MPKVNHVKKAQQRYATKPVIDPETGKQKLVPMMSSRTGEQKKSKSGRPVFLRVTERDLERPLPMPKCDAPTCTQPSREIAVGTSYKWIEPSGSPVRFRHAACPTWKQWEYSSSLSARIAQIQDEGLEDFDSLEDAQQWAADKAQEIRDLAEEKRESAQNIEDGFGHPTSQSEELNDIADQLDGWADELENVNLPSFPDAEDQECDDCDATGSVDDAEGIECEACHGTGKVTAETPSDEALEEWNEEVRNALEDALGSCPV